MMPEDANPPLPDPVPASSPTAPASLPFPVVGIGASAGGQEAVLQLLEHLPADPGMAFLLVMHLDPHHESQLAGILARGCRFTVREAADGMAVAANVLYVIPPNVTMTLADGHLRLQPRQGGAGPQMPIDQLFRSLAAVQHTLAIGVVLSGGGTDGTLGLQEISVEGIAFAQAEHTARHDAMPRSAIASGCVDFVLPPAEIARELVRIARHAYATQADRAGEPSLRDAGGLSSVFALLRASANIDFSHYKASTVNRRVQRRMALHNVTDLDAYVRLLADSPAEQHALYQDLLIRVTSFFRDPECFQALQQTVLPRLLAERAAGEPIRIWVSGCATGEEVYSLAILLLEHLGDMANNTPIKILATDVNNDALDKARAGVYCENIELDVSAERLRRFFFKQNGSYQVSKSIRDLCVFSRQNLVNDPPFSRLDLISCRNVLIYLDLSLQKRILPMFHYALKPGGCLLLGTSETIGKFTDMFSPASEKHRIFMRKAAPTVPVPLDFEFAGATHARRPAAAAAGKDGPLELQHEADRAVLARYGPAGVVVDEHLNILQFRGHTAPFLGPSPGQASLNLFKMAHGGLALELRKLINQARRDQRPLLRKGLVFEDGAGRRLINLEVIPLKTPPHAERCFLVLFTETETEAPPPPDAAHAGAGPAAAAPPNGADQRVAQLQHDLDATREHLQAVIEEHEGVNEELKSAHEEILSSNEELQSTNEELQAAKEEMQSANEELATVNDELRHRNLELGKLNDDLVNLFGGVNIPIVIVSRERRIRRMTAQAEKVFNLILGDVGRLLSDIRPNLEIADLDALIGEVIATLAVKELQAQDRAGRWHSVRIRPYVTLDNKIDGASVVAVEIDALKRSLEQTRRARDNAEAIIDAVHQPLLVLDGELRVQRANAAFAHLMGAQPGEIIQHSLSRLGQGQWDHPDLRQRLADVLQDGASFQDFPLLLDLSPGDRRSLVIHGQPINWDDSAAAMALLVIEDVTALRRQIEQDVLLGQEQAARAEAESANRTKDEFLAMLAHELRNPLAPLRNVLQLLRRSSGRPEDAPLLDMGDRQVRHMARLLEDLLDVSRVSRGKIELKKEPVDIAGLTARVVENVQQVVQAAGHQLHVRPPREPLFLEGDPVRLEQLFVNLLHNAAKYTPHGGRIDFEIDWEAGMAVFRVRDNGIGIAADMLPRVFDLFTQAERALDRSQGGLGIGLTLVKKLVELHGGTIHAASAGTGQGSEFTVRLPAQRGRLPTAARRAAPAPIATRHVLVVDDNPDALTSLIQLLELEGHQVQGAANGVEAVAAARATLPDVVFLDIGLPGMDGCEVARQLRQFPGAERMLLVALTGYGQEEDRQRSLRSGFDEHVVKPLEPGELRRLLGARPGG